MTIQYGGSAGGQPRLLIPTMNKFSDPNVQTAMQSILLWANRLMSGGGAIIDFGVYQAAGTIGTTTPNAVDWGALADGSFSYVGADNETVSFPPNALTFIFSSINLDYTTTVDSVFNYFSSAGLYGSPWESNILIGTHFKVTGSVLAITDNVNFPGTTTTMDVTLSTGTPNSLDGGGLLLVTMGAP